MSKDSFDVKKLPDDNILSLVLDSLPVRVYWKDLDFVIQGCNQKMANDLGLESPDDVIGKGYYDFGLSEEEISVIKEEDQTITATGEPLLELEESYKHPSGITAWIKKNKVPLFDEFGQMIGILETYEDITSEKHLQAKIEKMALEDSLTSLGNRAHFQMCLDATIEKSRKSNNPIGVMLIDLDNFKTVNDSAGHVCGDELLKKTAHILATNIPWNSMAMRLGGDEYAIVFDQINSMDYIIGLARKLLKAINTPQDIMGSVIQTTASIGIAAYPDNCSSREKLLINADVALYEAKINGKNQLCLFDNAIYERLREEHDIEENLPSAIQNNEFFLTYQPQISLETGKIVGLEALVRWNSPVLGMVHPERFIKVAEDTRLIIPMGRMVMDESFNLLSRVEKELGYAIPVSINVSLNQFRDPDFIPHVSNRLQETGVDPSLIEFEITESVAMYSSYDITHRMQELKSIGVTLAVDDFGTGYSSLSRLKDYPFDRIKIDKSFIDAINQRGSGAIIAGSIIQLAHSLDMRVIAEGVETEEQLTFLVQQRCYEAQGYFYSKPLEPETLMEYLHKHNPQDVLELLADLKMQSAQSHDKELSQKQIQDHRSAASR